MAYYLYRRVVYSFMAPLFLQKDSNLLLHHYGRRALDGNSRSHRFLHWHHRRCSHLLRRLQVPPPSCSLCTPLSSEKWAALTPKPQIRSVPVSQKQLITTVGALLNEKGILIRQYGYPPLMRDRFEEQERSVLHGIAT